MRRDQLRGIRAFARAADQRSKRARERDTGHTAPRIGRALALMVLSAATLWEVDASAQACMTRTGDNSFAEYNWLSQGSELRCGAGANADILYRTYRARTTALRYCEYGCEVKPVRHNNARQDECKGPPDRKSVLVQAGHENTGSNCRGTSLTGDTGADGEAAWTAAMASCVTDKLVSFNIDARRGDANFNCDPAATRHYDAAVAIHYQPDHLFQTDGYFVGKVEPALDPASTASERLRQKLEAAYQAVGIPRNQDPDWGEIPVYYLKNNDLLNDSSRCGFVLAQSTPLVVLEAGVGAPGGAEHDVLRSRSLQVCDAIVQGLRDYLATVPAATPSPAPGTLRIMPVGDSITHALEGDYSWRYRLHEHLKRYGVAFDFVGPYRGAFDSVNNAQGAYAVADWDSDHDAWWGRFLADEASVIAQRMASYTPDLLLVHLGTNDLTWGRVNYSPTTAVDNMRRLIDNARSVNPNIDVIIAAIGDTAFIEDSDKTAYNQLLAQLAVSMRTPPSDVRLADVATGWDWNVDTYDKTHPDARGEYKIAKAFADTLYTDLHKGGAFVGVPTALPPPRPTEVRFEPVSLNSPSQRFRVRWQRVVNDVWTPYKVRIRFHKNFGYNVVWESDWTSDDFLDYTGPALPQTGVYHVEVVAGANGFSTASAPQALQVGGAPIPKPPAPSNVRLTPNPIGRDGGFIASWDRVSNSVWTVYRVELHYHVNYGYGLVWQSALTPDLSLMYDGPRLPQTGVYSVAVVAHDIYGQEQRSAPIDLTVVEQVPAPLPPQNVVLDPGVVWRNGNFTVRWERVPNPKIWTTYIVEVRYHQAYGGNLVWTSPETFLTEMKYGGPVLPQAGTFQVRVLATDKVHTTPSAFVPLVCTGNPPPPPAPTGIVVSPNPMSQQGAFAVSWERVQQPGVWTVYDVELKYHAAYGGAPVWKLYDVTDIRAERTGPALPQTGTYQLFVIARDSFQQEQRSLPIDVVVQ